MKLISKNKTFLYLWMNSQLLPLSLIYAYLYVYFKRSIKNKENYAEMVLFWSFKPKYYIFILHFNQPLSLIETEIPLFSTHCVFCYLQKVKNLEFLTVYQRLNIDFFYTVVCYTSYGYRDEIDYLKHSSWNTFLPTYKRFVHRIIRDICGGSGENREGSG